MGSATEFLSDAVLTSRVSNAVAAGTTDIDSSSVDLGSNPYGYGVRFIALFGAITATAVTSVKIAVSADNSNFTDVTGTTVSLTPSTHDNKIVIVEIKRPQERYVRCTIDRGTANAVVDGIIAEIYDLTYEPPTHGSTVVDVKKVHKTG